MAQPDLREPNLADLINDRRGTRSFSDLERACGGTVTRARFHQLATIPNQTQFPTPTVLRALVQVLNVPTREVVLAAARSVGLVIPPEDPSVLAVAGAGSLRDDQKEMLLALARDMIRSSQTSSV